MPAEVDALVIGAGPIGLFQVFELGLLDINAHVVDTLPYPGGQCIELYADKPIYDIPSVAVCTGRELIDNLLRQAAPFKPTFHLGQEVSVIQQREDGRFDVETTASTRFIAKSLFIAGGVGSFQRRELKVQGLADYEGRQLFYRPDDAGQFAGRHVLIAGSGDAALEWAIRLADPQADVSAKAASVTLVHRRDVFTAEPATIARLRELRDVCAVRFIAGQINGGEEHEGRLTHLSVALSEGGDEAVPVDAVLVLLGVSPKLGPIADWGLALERKQVVVDTEKFETSVPGIFAVGDVNTYPGKRKLIVSGFHEATLAAFAASPYVYPDKRVLLQYTTTSTKLHQALGVASAVAPRSHPAE
ncbi:NAD(P)/FAD-dependent oxidoreductase [soil metagenome]